mgnify:FL=1|tara:strand:- start:225 stop:455 length:231 start_codon:yes stop_codon:yes gene_type:complete
MTNDFDEYEDGVGGFAVYVGDRGTFYEDEVVACEAYDELTEGMTEQEVLRMAIGMEVLTDTEVADMYWDKAVSVIQ